MAVLFSAASPLTAQAQQQAPQAPNMTFFVTGFGPGKGEDIGGIEGADRYCRQLAQGAGAGGRTWRAYLSTQAADGKPAINARDHIGAGPWQNFKGEVVAQNVDDLHSDNNKLNMQSSLTERGAMIPDGGYAPNGHDASPGRNPMAAPSRPAKIGPATTGRAARKAPPCWVTSTASFCATTRHLIRGIFRIRHAGQTGATAKPICAALAETACSIASQLNRPVARTRTVAAGRLHSDGIIDPRAGGPERLARDT